MQHAVEVWSQENSVLFASRTDSYEASRGDTVLRLDIGALRWEVIILKRQQEAFYVASQEPKADMK